MLHAARTPGEQGIYRAELYAILYLYERLSNIAIHTDSHVTLSTIQRCLDAKTFGNLHNLNDLDLIQRLWVVLQTGTRRFFKVKAHCKDEIEISWLTLYHRLGNKRANDIAITTGWFMFPQLVADM